VGWKIVRDYQREFCKESGVSGRWRVSPDPKRALMKKLFEEASEFAENEEASELYDLRDVLQELLHVCDPDGVWEFRHARKIARRGLFAMHLEWCPIPEGSELDPEKEDYRE